MQRERRLVDRVLRTWKEMAVGGRFPRRDQIEPSMLGEDWENCLVITVQSPVQLSQFVAVGNNLSHLRCPNNEVSQLHLSRPARWPPQLRRRPTPRTIPKFHHLRGR